MALKYTTTLQLNKIVKQNARVPSRDIGGTPTKEDVGTGDNSIDTFYLAHDNIIASTYTLYYGASESAASSTLTETTDYTLDLTTGKITLTAGGITTLGVNTIFAEYQYNSIGLTDEDIQTTLERAEQQVDSILNTTFTDGTTTNPTYPNLLENMPSQGLYDRRYRVANLPLIDISSTLDANITDSDTSLTVASGDGSKFPTSGKIVIGNEIISYTGISTDTLTGLTRGEDSSSAAAHTAADEIHTTIVEISETVDGNTPSFQTLSWGNDYYAEDNGNIYIHEDTKIDNIPQDIPNRVKIRHYHGYDSIPEDIVRLTLLLAKRELIQDNIGKALIEGRNEFKPEMFNVDINEINRIVDAYRINAMKST